MYITLAQTQTLIGRLLDVYKDDQDVVDTDHLQLVIDEAEGMINSAIGSRYDIPVTGTNAVNFLRSLVVPIIRYKTTTQFAETENISEGIQLEYKMALKTLSQLAKQEMSLPDTDEKTTGRAEYISVILTDTSTRKY